MQMDEEQATMPSNQADADSQLFATLCEIDKNNYLYLFERCKALNVAARQLKYFNKDHIRELIPKTQLGVLAEFEFLLKEWQKRNNVVAASSATPAAIQISTVTVGTMTDAINTKNTGINTTAIECETTTEGAAAAAAATALLLDNSIFLKDPLHSPLKSDDESQSSFGSTTTDAAAAALLGKRTYHLNQIIASDLKKCQRKYKLNGGLLTEADRRMLSAAIIDYFICRQIPLTATMIDQLSDEIAQVFPTESKRAWYDRSNSKGRGRLYVKYYNSHRNKVRVRQAKARQQEELEGNSNSPYVLHEESMNEDMFEEVDEVAEQTKKWLKCNKCEDMQEVLGMWRDCAHLRRRQLRSIDPNLEYTLTALLDEWPAYKWPTGHILLNYDYCEIHPHSLAAYQQRCPIFMTKILNLMEAELKDVPNTELFKQYKLMRHELSEDSKLATLLHLLHAITKPSRCFNTRQGSRRYSIAESQQSFMRLIPHISFLPSQNDAALPPHPCIYVVGESLLQLERCFVTYGTLRYELHFVEAVTACMQLFLLFKLDLPLASMNFWTFVRGYLYDVTFPQQRTYAVMDNIVKYLETYVVTQ